MKINYLFKEYVPKSLFKLMSDDEKQYLNNEFDVVLSTKGFKYLSILTTFIILFIAMYLDSSIFGVISAALLMISIILGNIEEKLERRIETIILDMIVMKGITEEVKQEWSI